MPSSIIPPAASEYVGVKPTAPRKNACVLAFMTVSSDQASTGELIDGAQRVLRERRFAAFKPRAGNGTLGSATETLFQRSLYVTKRRLHSSALSRVEGAFFCSGAKVVKVGGCWDWNLGVVEALDARGRAPNEAENDAPGMLKIC